MRALMMMLTVTGATLVTADAPMPTLINKLADFFLDLPQFDYPVAGVCALGASRQQQMADASHIQTTRSDSCGDVTVIFARGSCEPGNVGISAGPPFFEALQATLPGRRVAINGLKYPADFKEFLAAQKGSGDELAAMIRAAVDNCRGSRIVVGGYSLGARIVHDAAEALGQSYMSKISSVVLFGDPYAKSAVSSISPSRVLVLCHSDDDICKGGQLISMSHLTYSQQAQTAANFVVSRL
ncbi:hypothetical protein L249_0858 [Ophiocordyceps polyrhachis-furcata BCC 54312]|uniref:cutinase n=1 Tax=Ophiocordyceps polyrhachis-furcata BCC 54312 TaxID=1330021 RepID=A0A367LE68_9HYPO|nr:hypothetical protein L249_0858 [Ophiocordyceps polyrhachis-furcata BCC 54312]